MINHPADQYKAIAGSAYSTLDTLRSSYDIGFRAGMELSGDIVECGIAAGSNFAMMMLGCLKAEGNTFRKFWGYDSFEGIQLAGKKDTEQAGIGAITHNTDVEPSELLVSSGVTVHPAMQVISNLNGWGLGTANYKLVKGWVQNTVPFDKPEKIAVLRLDMDVYDPTIFVLNELYDRIEKGGYIIIDDWALDGVKTAVQEFWEARGLRPKIQTVPNSTPVYWVKA